jgi:hypothetical protein
LSIVWLAVPFGRGPPSRFTERFQGGNFPFQLA